MLKRPISLNLKAASIKIGAKDGGQYTQTTSITPELLDGICMELEKIYQHEVKPQINALLLPKNAQVIAFSEQRDLKGRMRMYIWYIFPDENTDELTPREFRLMPTGQAFTGEGYEFLGTTVCDDGHVWHLFENKLPQENIYTEESRSTKH